MQEGLGADVHFTAVRDLHHGVHRDKYGFYGHKALSDGCALDADPRECQQLLRFNFHYRGDCTHFRYAIDVFPGSDVRV